jgi:hypothetical protein
MTNFSKQPISKNRFEVNKGKWDILGSTFFWKLYLENGKVFKGYSKGLNIPEKANKNHLFITFVNRVWTKNYIKKCYKMEIYKNDPVFSDHDLACVLTKDDFDLQPYFFKNKEIEEFLKKTYEGLRTGEMPDLTVKVQRNTGMIINKLDETMNFQTAEELKSYCVSKANDGFEKGEVLSFYYKMIEKVENRQRNKKTQAPSQPQAQQQQPQTHSNTETQTEFRRTPKVSTNSEGRIQPEAPVPVEKTWIETYKESKIKELHTLFFKFNHINPDARVKQTISVSFDNAQNKNEVDDYYQNFHSLILSKKLR